MKSSGPRMPHSSASGYGAGFVAEGHTEADFEDMVNQLVSQGGPVTQMLRRFHAEHGMYPTFAEICPPGGPVVGMLQDL
jgi:hypothetical protein